MKRFVINVEEDFNPELDGMICYDASTKSWSFVPRDKFAKPFLDQLESEKAASRKEASELRERAFLLEERLAKAEENIAKMAKIIKENLL